MSDEDATDAEVDSFEEMYAEGKVGSAVGVRRLARMRFQVWEKGVISGGNGSLVIWTSFQVARSSVCRRSRES